MSDVRAAAVAGRFYPGQPAQLIQDVDGMLAQARTEAPCPKAVVAPHAGYIYSGSIAAEVYARVHNGAQTISRVVLLGPSHRVAFEGIATTGASFYATPLGQIPLDKAATRSIESLADVHQLDRAHAQEHSLEVHLPFLQRSLESFSLIPLVVGRASPASVAQVIQKLWGGPETLVIVSSDLSHFLPYEEARTKDAETRQLIEQRATNISGDQACGCMPLNGLLEVLRQRELPISTIDVKNSGDTAGSKDRVVGYGAWVVEAASTAETDPVESGDNNRKLSTPLRQQLLALASDAIKHRLDRRELNIPTGGFHPDLLEHRGTFVTLKQHGKLRGCIGSLTASRPLFVDVVHNALAAAFKDPRFKPVAAEEYPSLEMHISVLSVPETLSVGGRAELEQQLRPGIDGLILQEGSRRSTYLPSVWDSIPQSSRFVGDLLAKAGLPREGWSENMQVWTYTTEEFC